MAATLDDLRTTEDAGRDRPSHGPAWDAAIAAGIDVTLLEHRVGLAPYARLRESIDLGRFAARVRRRTVAPEVERSLARRLLIEKLAAFGLTLEDALPQSHGDRR